MAAAAGSSTPAAVVEIERRPVESPQLPVIQKAASQAVVGSTSRQVNTAENRQQSSQKATTVVMRASPEPIDLGFSTEEEAGLVSLFAPVADSFANDDDFFHGVEEDSDDFLYVHENRKRRCYTTLSRRPEGCNQRLWSLWKQIGSSFRVEGFRGSSTCLSRDGLFQAPEAARRHAQSVARRKELIAAQRGRRVSLKPDEVSDLFIDFLRGRGYTEHGYILRTAAGVPASPHHEWEYDARRETFEASLASARLTWNLPRARFYKNKVQLVMEGVEPNPGPPSPLLDAARFKRRFGVWIDRLFPDSDTHTLKTIMVSYEHALYEDAVVRKEENDAWVKRFENWVQQYVQFDELSLSSYLRSRAFVAMSPDDATPRFGWSQTGFIDDPDPKSEVGAKLSSFIELVADGSKHLALSILADFLEAGFSLQGTVFHRCAGWTFNIKGDSLAADATHTRDPRSSPVPAPPGKVRNLSPVPDDYHATGDECASPHSGPSHSAETSRHSTVSPLPTGVLSPLESREGSPSSSSSSEEEHESVMEKATMKREAREDRWAGEHFVPLGLLDLARYKMELQGHFVDDKAIKALSEAIYQTHEQFGMWFLEYDRLEEAINAAEKERLSKMNSSIPSFRPWINQSFPFHLVLKSTRTERMLEEEGLEIPDGVYPMAQHLAIPLSDLWTVEFVEQSDVYTSVLAYSETEEFTVRFPHTWFNVCSQRHYGAFDSFNEVRKVTAMYLDRAPKEQMPPEWHSFSELRISIFAGVLRACARSYPGRKGDFARFAQAFRRDQPVAGGVYVEPYITSEAELVDKYRAQASPAYYVGRHTVDDSFIAVSDSDEERRPYASWGRVGRHNLLAAYARPDSDLLTEQLNGVIKRLAVGRIPLSEAWQQRLQEVVWPAVRHHIESRRDSLHHLSAGHIRSECELHCRAKGFSEEDTAIYMEGVNLFLAGADGEPNLLPAGWRTQYGCFTKSENYALSGKKPCRSIQCPDMFVRGYQHALLMEAQENLFTVVFPHLSIKHMTEAEKTAHIKKTFAHSDRVLCTDLTAMEKNVNAFMMGFEEAVFASLSSEWMRPAIHDCWRELCSRPREIAHKMFSLITDPMRASGEDHTSAGNFVCNLMWICAWRGQAEKILSGEIACLVEGDDGQVDATDYVPPSAQDIAGLGIRIKLEEDVDQSSFVSKVIRGGKEMCNVLDIAQNFSIIRDPDFESRINDLPHQYAVAMSYYLLYGQFPVVGRYFLDVLIRDHDEAMGTQRRMRAVRRAFDRIFLGWFDPHTAERMWENALSFGELPGELVCTAAELADYNGISQAFLYALFDETDRNSRTVVGYELPTGPVHVVEDCREAYSRTLHKGEIDTEFYRDCVSTHWYSLNEETRDCKETVNEYCLRTGATRTKFSCSGRTVLDRTRFTPKVGVRMPELQAECDLATPQLRRRTLWEVLFPIFLVMGIVLASALVCSLPPMEYSSPPAEQVSPFWPMVAPPAANVRRDFEGMSYRTSHVREPPVTWWISRPETMPYTYRLTAEKHTGNTSVFYDAKSVLTLWVAPRPYMDYQSCIGEHCAVGIDSCRSWFFEGSHFSENPEDQRPMCPLPPKKASALPVKQSSMGAWVVALGSILAVAGLVVSWVAFFSRYYDHVLFEIEQDQIARGFGGGCWFP